MVIRTLAASVSTLWCSWDAVSMRMHMIYQRVRRVDQLSGPPGALATASRSALWVAGILRHIARVPALRSSNVATFYRPYTDDARARVS